MHFDFSIDAGFRLAVIGDARAASGRLGPAQAADAPPAISIHPDNPKYFLFRGRPLALITASEHYGSVVNRAFDFERYLADAADKRQTLTRTFLLFREQQSSAIPARRSSPRRPDYLAPYPRTGPGKAMDGEPAYDLDQWNGEYFARLHKFLDCASRLGIVVELTLFSNTYGDGVWASIPCGRPITCKRSARSSWQDYTSLKNSALNERQFAFARKIIDETHRYDNVYYEISATSPGAGCRVMPRPPTSTPGRRNAGIVRRRVERLQSTHLVLASQAFSLHAQVSPRAGRHVHRQLWPTG